MQLCEALEGTGFSPCSDFESRARLLALRKLYEPHACVLANYLKLSLPAWVAPPLEIKQTDAWTVVSGLRAPQVLADRLTSHVSTRSTAVHLEHHDRDNDD